jgi:hypothetical protein
MDVKPNNNVSTLFSVSGPIQHNQERMLNKVEHIYGNTGERQFAFNIQQQFQKGICDEHNPR